MGPEHRQLCPLPPGIGWETGLLRQGVEGFLPIPAGQDRDLGQEHGALALLLQYYALEPRRIIAG